MKKIFLILIMFIAISLFLSVAVADEYKLVKIGHLWNKIVDSGNQGESFSAGKAMWLWNEYDHYGDLYVGAWGGWVAGANCQQSATYALVKDWTDPNGTFYPYMQSGMGGGRIDEQTVTVPIPDANGNRLRVYYRYDMPSIVVDGMVLNDPFPLINEEVDPDIIPGTAEIMVESIINMNIGITIDQKVYAWSQKNHDDYIIYDWTYTNTGNTDLDDEIELPNQTLNGLIIWRASRMGPAGIGFAGPLTNWTGIYGPFEGDTLRMTYAYGARTKAAVEDNFGFPTEIGFLREPDWLGEATLYVQTAPNNTADWDIQPFVSGMGYCDIKFANQLWYDIGNDQMYSQYKIGSEGFQSMAGQWDNQLLVGTKPGTFHAVPLELRDDLKFVEDYEYSFWHPWQATSSGPWDLAPGESIRYVYAFVAGYISRVKGFEVGKAWRAGNAAATWEGEYKLSPKNAAYPDLASTDNDKAKDSWVYTGRDSLFMNANAAQWAFDNDYEVPIAPPAPSIEVSSLPDRIHVAWGSESEAASDFAGYRLYRAIPTTDSIFWHPIFECGEGTANPLIHEFDDETAARGIGYAYYVAAFDDGVSNAVGVKGVKESLESGSALNETTIQPAHLSKPPGTSLDEIVVVPNPFNIAAEELQYPGEEDKIMFLNLPGYCTIKIFNEGGDLIKTLVHDDGSGDQAWGRLPEQWQASEDGQVIVSGIYIAAIEVTDVNMNPTGEKKLVKFLIVR